MSTVRQFFLTAPNCPYTTGGILMMPNNSIRDGYIYCNGVAISRTDYHLLYNVIGTIYGAGNGSTTFNVPDYEGRVLRGWGGNAAGFGVDQWDEFQSHTHNLRIGTSSSNTGQNISNGYGGAIASSSTGDGSRTKARNKAIRFGIRYI